MAAKADDLSASTRVQWTGRGITQLDVGHSGSAAGKDRVPGMVSVIIPAFNASQYIQESVESALSQTYQNLEILVVDDGSTDDTQAVLSPYISQKKIKYFYQSNQGQGQARNLAIRNSKGEFIAFLDADDVWSCHQKLEKQIAYLQKNMSVGFVYSDATYFGDDWEKQKKASKKLREYENRKTEYFTRGNTYKSLLKFNYIISSSVVVRRNILDKTDAFSNEVRFFEDLELWLRIAKVCDMDFTLERLVKRRFHQGQLTHDKRHGYRDSCYLYGYLLFQHGSQEKLVIARKYAENALKRMVAWALRW